MHIIHIMSKGPKDPIRTRNISMPASIDKMAVDLSIALFRMVNVSLLFRVLIQEKHKQLFGEGK